MKSDSTEELYMKMIEYHETIGQAFIPEYYQYLYPDSKLLFFDIETTGFTAKNSTLYLIGALWYENNSIRILQWFNEDGNSEKQLLSSFNVFCKNFTHLVHFNGLGFDLPYLKQKTEMLKIPFSIGEQLTHIDIYKEIRSYKKIFFLNNMKQISIEHYLGIHRKDTYTGKELINIYLQYAAHPDDEKEHILLLHNHDDLLGMPQISRILNYKAFFEKISISSLEITLENKQLKFRFSYESSAYLPKRLSLSANGMYLNAFEQESILYIPVVEDTLMHYFNDYQNYYYLPMEDMAIHKSVASYVEADNREKATKSTCYIKKTDAFIPCHNTDEYDVFKSSITDKCNYQTVDSLLNANFQKQTTYIQRTLSVFKNYSK